eukprot:TRINITY_DN101_c0_g1_i5.p1 TRINITY_DN101_c0_g1~~TRINITY_DN101_c0_g1_i5.p1  ORF type:complete len:274 (+),score=81.36 TRINITY_DN101_c0_g1_i5:179-1000(+)
MHRTLPTMASKVCQERWDEYNLAVHKEKLAKIKPSIDNTPPKAATHLDFRRKRDQMREERLSTIEKDNLILLQKMTNIMKSPSTIDNRNTRHKKKSLNRDVRKTEIDRISTENEKLLKRLQSVKPSYDHTKWDDERKENEKILKRICEKPPFKKDMPKPIGESEKTSPVPTRRAPMKINRPKATKKIVKSNSTDSLKSSLSLSDPEDELKKKSLSDRDEPEEKKDEEEDKKSEDSDGLGSFDSFDEVVNKEEFDEDDEEYRPESDRSFESEGK